MVFFIVIETLCFLHPLVIDVYKFEFYMYLSWNINTNVVNKKVAVSKIEYFLLDFEVRMFR